MPSQLLFNQEFPDDDQDVPADDVYFINPLPCAINIMSPNSATYPNHGFAVPISSSNYLAGFWHNHHTLYGSTQNYDRGTGSVGHSSSPAVGANSLPYIGEFTPYNGYQWQNIPSPSAVESSQVIFASQPTNQPNSIPLQSHFPFPPLLLHCGWLCEGIHCTFTGTLEELRLHCRAVHFCGPKNTPIKCQWKDCVYYKRGDRAVHVMRRDCVWRHTCEKHLALKRGT